MNESGTEDVHQFTQSASQRWCDSLRIGLRSHLSRSGTEFDIQSEQAIRTASQLALSCGFFWQNLSTRHAPYIPFSRRKANASPTDGSFFLAAIRLGHFLCEQLIILTRVGITITGPANNPQSTDQIRGHRHTRSQADLS